MPDPTNQIIATPNLDELDDARATIERLAHANQDLTQRLDREHSMRLAAEERASEAESKHRKGFDIGSIDPGMRAVLLGTVGEASLVAETSGPCLKAWDIPDLSEPIEPAPLEVCDECGAETDDEGCAINPSSAALASWEFRAHEAEAALEALRADVERDRASIRYRLPDVSGTMGQVAIYSVCELLAAWGRAQDVEHCRENRRRAVLFHRNAKESIERADDALYGRR